MACEMQVVPGPHGPALQETYEFPAPFASPESACRVECRRAAIGYPKVLHHHVVGGALV